MAELVHTHTGLMNGTFFRTLRVRYELKQPE